MTKETTAEILSCYPVTQFTEDKWERYGHKNITDFGKLGVLVRVNDKISRLKNLHQKKRKNPLEDETIIDTWRDVGCYSIIWLLLEKKIFELPLKEEKS